MPRGTDTHSGAISNSFKAAAGWGLHAEPARPTPSPWTATSHCLLVLGEEPWHSIRPQRCAAWQRPARPATFSPGCGSPVWAWGPDGQVVTPWGAHAREPSGCA